MDIRNGEQEFAVKLFSNKEAKPTEKRMQFETELNTITKLNHPHMLPLLGYGSHQNSLCLIYPYMALGSLDKYLSKSEFNSHQRITVIQDIASALHYLHNGCNDDVLVHRDVKSANILLDPHWRGILTDFGIARTIDIGSSTVSTQRIIGTRVYMAPEYCTGVVSPAADVYSLGIVMYELLFGCLANDGPPNSNTDILSYLDEYDGITSDLYLSCWNEQDGDKLERLADNCTNEYRTSRPSIELILQTL
jgi:interleukin-1 receptor-associated kinase 4